MVRLHHGTHFHPFVGPAHRTGGIVHHPDDRRGLLGHLVRDHGDRDGRQRPVDEQGRERLPAQVAAQPGDLATRARPVPGRRAGQHARTSSPASRGSSASSPRRARAVALDGTPLQFAGWSDGKSIRHVITTPVNDTTYTATYQPSQPFTGKYYANTTFSGAPVLTRQDQNVNFVWGSGLTRSRTARRRLLRALDQDPVVRRRPLPVHHRRRRRRPPLHRRQAGDRPVAGTREHGVQLRRRARHGQAHDQDGVRRVRR